MEFRRRHWTIALLAAVFLQFALAAALHRPHTDLITGRHAGVEIQIGSNLTSDTGKEGQESVAAVQTASIPPASNQVQDESPATLEPAAAERASPPEKNELKAVDLPASRPESASIPATKSLSLAKTHIQPATETKVNPAQQKKQIQSAVKKATPPRSGIGESITDGGQSTQTAKLTTSKISGNTGEIIADAHSSGGNAPVSATISPEYYRKLTAWLEKHKRYPRRAVQRRQQGVVKVSFRIDRKGNLLSRKIIGSSGYRLLDEAADSLLQRASPMPEIPHQSVSQVLEIIVPIMYALR